MSALLVCVVVSGAKFSVKKGLSALREWMFSPSIGLQESKHKLQKHWNFWKHHSPKLLLSLHVENEIPRKIKSNRVPLYSNLNSVMRKKALLVQGHLHK